MKDGGVAGCRYHTQSTCLHGTRLLPLITVHTMHCRARILPKYSLFVTQAIETCLGLTMVTLGLNVS